MNSDERLVIQVAKRKSECILALAQLGPMYISPNIEEGKRECEQFFPEDYAMTLDEEDWEFEILSVQTNNLEKDQQEADEPIPEEIYLNNELTEQETAGEGIIEPTEEIENLQIDGALPEGYVG